MHGFKHARSALRGVTIPEDMVRRETENVVALTPAQEEVEGLVQKVTLLEGELAEAC
jgi:hypothetical protein